MLAGAPPPDPETESAHRLAKGVSNTITKKREETDRSCVGSTSCNGTGATHFRMISTTLGIHTRCGWSFGHSRAPVVVPKCARWPIGLILFLSILRIIW